MARSDAACTARSRVALYSQHYALFPAYDSAQNIAFRSWRMLPARSALAAADIASRWRCIGNGPVVPIWLIAFLRGLPGGQKGQRIALARALGDEAADPAVGRNLLGAAGPKVRKETCAAGCGPTGIDGTGISPAYLLPMTVKKP